jgi:hypothetical protein
VEGNAEIFGATVEGRPLWVQYWGDPAAKLRLFILAGQHGDEADGRKAVQELAGRLAGGSFLPPAHLALVADANPDGTAAGTRRNAAEVDLNRDHLLLSAPETEAIHALVARCAPDLILDVHTYRPWRKELLVHDLVFPQDVMMDFPTNPAVCTTLGDGLQRKALQFVMKRLAEEAIRCDRYTLIRSPIVRHSNLHIVDARNALALRFGIPVVLLEGRRASPEDTLTFEAPPAALLRSILAVIDWAVRNSELLRKRPSAGAAVVPVRCHCSGSRIARQMEMQSASTGAISKVPIPGTYVPAVKTTRTVRSPRAYAIPRHLTGILDVLSKHRFRTMPSDAFRSSIIERYRIETLIPGYEEDLPALPLCSLEPAPVNLEDFVLFPTEQQGGSLLTLLLEPESQFGPHRFGDLAETLQPGANYPVMRVL